MSFKEFRFGKMTTHWESKRIIDYTEIVTDYVANGSFASLKENVTYFEDPNYAVLIRLTDYNRGFDGQFVYIDEHAYNFLSKTQLFGGEIIISNVGANVGTVFKVPYLRKKMNLGPNSIMVKTKGNDDFYFYWFSSPNGQESIKSILSGSAQPKFNKTSFRNLELPIPPYKEQNAIAHILSTLDDKIEVNNEINKTLENMAQAYFDDMFPNVAAGDTTIGEYITPKRGKNLLSKDAISGEVPVIAGGLSPATYHNVSNTQSPVITISASGANAGFVNLWTVPVWSSDSSFIDYGMTKDVYFWYVMLKKRQKEIYDSQTGSAQPHIYPKHITIMPTIKLNVDEINLYTKRVTPLFKKIANNLYEISKLQLIRDTLLPKLMSGEIRVPMDEEGDVS